jgi:hypothetical protein
VSHSREFMERFTFHMINMINAEFPDDDDAVDLFVRVIADVLHGRLGVITRERALLDIAQSVVTRFALLDEVEEASD